LDYTRNKNILQKAKVRYIKYCKFLCKGIQEYKNQHYSRLIANIIKKNNKNNIEHYKERDWKYTFSRAGPHLTGE